ncbi:PIN domain protein [Thioalkalicoccus limnaeus]|uniref:PIN domain protein n=1 Tax=Thioalkalicoccus limnaeus TaxID=120681 RepID=A0ABV4BLW6_9GAMM
MKVYLDNCCFNRPYDDQSHLRIRLEAEAKLKIQEETRNGVYELIWSYILDYENSKNPFKERREQIAEWRKYAAQDVAESKEILVMATMLQEQGIKKIDSLHIACAIEAHSDYFLTTDDGILKKATLFQEVKITDPIGFIKEVLT